MAHYREALRLAPFWYYTHINMGIAQSRMGQIDSATVSYDRAVENDRYSGHARTWRGEFRLTLRDFAGARDDFATSGRLSLQTYRNVKGLATAYAGLGDITRSLEQTLRLIGLDSATALTDVPGISTPYFANPALRMAGIDFYRRLALRLPGTWWIPENIARLERLIASEEKSGARTPQVRQAAAR
jgi:tetratricopeptide (TPR) repeat protein